MGHRLRNRIRRLFRRPLGPVLAADSLATLAATLGPTYRDLR
ncbi:hypothetical protein AB0D32_09415 [Micromonospora sp. NPDC048170]